jgi:hypothetical protein
MDNILEEIKQSYKTKPNKDLVKILETLHVDFENIKSTIVPLTQLLEQIEDVYDIVYEELNNRTKFDKNG